MNAEVFIKLSKEGEGTKVETKLVRRRYRNLCMRRYARS